MLRQSKIRYFPVSVHREPSPIVNRVARLLVLGTVKYLKVASRLMNYFTRLMVSSLALLYTKEGKRKIAIQDHGSHFPFNRPTNAYKILIM